MEGYYQALTNPDIDLDNIEEESYFKQNMFYDDEIISTIDSWGENEGLPDEDDRETIENKYENGTPSIRKVLEDVDASPDEVIRYLVENDFEYLNPGQEIK